MELTGEQIKVVNTELEIGESLVVESAAGTGKTSCLIEFSKQKRDKKILYICFNNKGAAEAKDKYREAGVFNTTTSTIHGLARVVKAQYTKANKFQTKITIKDIQKWVHVDQKQAWGILECIKSFCESKDQTINEVHMSETLKGSDKIEALRVARKIWGMMVDTSNPMPISYDHYLKIFDLSNPKLKYDYILVDEAQDCNPVSLSLLEKQREKTRVVLIGDQSQAIYGWRGAKNAMASWGATKTLSLSESFRFGKNIAQTANLILENYQGTQKNIVGRGGKDSLGPIPSSVPKTLIARTNATLLEAAITENKKGGSCHFIGTTETENYDPSLPYKFNDAIDVYNLWIGSHSSIRNPHIRAFSSYQEFKVTGNPPPTITSSGEVVVNKGDKEIESLCKIVEKYGHKLPTLLSEIAKRASDPINATLTLVTAHRAKGLEWDYVEIADDFCKLIINEEETKEVRLTRVDPNDEGLKGGDVNIEELNLLYVACTRAKKRLQPSLSLREVIESPWLLKPETNRPSITPWDKTQGVKAKKSKVLIPINEKSTHSTLNNLNKSKKKEVMTDSSKIDKFIRKNKKKENHEVDI
jgi:F-box protein, helicase, 18